MDQVGTVPAALTTYLAIQAFQPDIVISTGTAGGFRAKGAAIADVFVSTGMVNHDRRIPIPVGRGGGRAGGRALPEGRGALAGAGGGGFSCSRLGGGSLLTGALVRLRVCVGVVGRRRGCGCEAGLVGGGFLARQGGASRAGVEPLPPPRARLILLLPE